MFWLDDDVPGCWNQFLPDVGLFSLLLYIQRFWSIVSGQDFFFWLKNRPVQNGACRLGGVFLELGRSACCTHGIIHGTTLTLLATFLEVSLEAA